MTDTILFHDLDQHIANFESFITGAEWHPLPPYNFDREVNMHPWIKRLYYVNVDIWGVMVEQIRPAIHEARTARTGEAELLQRYETLFGLSNRLEAIIHRCTRGAPWMAGGGNPIHPEPDRSRR
jgi:hypothetical protein